MPPAGGNRTSLASYTWGGWGTQEDIAQFSEVFQPDQGIFSPSYPLVPPERERVRLWGRVVHTWPGQREPRGPDTRQLTAAGRRIGFATVVLALFQGARQEGYRLTVDLPAQTVSAEPVSLYNLSVPNASVTYTPGSSTATSLLPSR